MRYDTDPGCVTCGAYNDNDEAVCDACFRELNTRCAICDEWVENPELEDDLCPECIKAIYTSDEEIPV